MGGQDERTGEKNRMHFSLIFVEKVSFLPADTSVEAELGRHPQGFKEMCTKCRMQIVYVLK